DLPTGAYSWFFKSKLYDISFQVEYNIYPYSCGDEKWSPYLLAGLSFYNFVPQAIYPNGRWGLIEVLDHKNRTVRKGTQLAIPLGGGVKYYLGKGWHAGFEFGIRKTLTDF
ncbi:MAG: hypothetical protein IH946_08870, partial [Bacteroidetes bacterium]|nr:hypothetical protein [Bacteroidota bacterium]